MVDTLGLSPTEVDPNPGLGPDPHLGTVPTTPKQSPTTGTELKQDPEADPDLPPSHLADPYTGMDVADKPTPKGGIDLQQELIPNPDPDPDQDLPPSHLADPGKCMEVADNTTPKGGIDLDQGSSHITLDQCPDLTPETEGELDPGADPEPLRGSQVLSIGAGDRDLYRRYPGRSQHTTIVNAWIMVIGLPGQRPSMPPETRDARPSHPPNAGGAAPWKPQCVKVIMRSPNMRNILGLTSSRSAGKAISKRIKL